MSLEFVRYVCECCIVDGNADGLTNFGEEAERVQAPMYRYSTNASGVGTYEAGVNGAPNLQIIP